MSGYYYAVREGRNKGVYETWNECKREVIGYQGAKYKKFATMDEAQEFMNLSTPSRSRSTYRRAAVDSTKSSSGNSHRSKPYDRPEASRSLSKRSRNNQPQSDTGVQVIYTDGASRGNGKDSAVAGYGVYWGDNHPNNVSASVPRSERQTNQRAEMHAVIHALGQTKESNHPIEICTDSIYCIKALTQWYRKWETNDWQSSTGKPVQNCDLMQKALGLLNGRRDKVKFTYVPGHSGVYGNEQADALAVEGARNSE